MSYLESNREKVKKVVIELQVQGLLKDYTEEKKEKLITFMTNQYDKMDEIVKTRKPNGKEISVPIDKVIKLGNFDINLN